MWCQQALTILGIVLQFCGAAYVVWKSRGTTRSLERFGDRITWDKLGPLLNSLRDEMRGQYAVQRVGFLWVALGAIAQLVAEILPLLTPPAP